MDLVSDNDGGSDDFPALGAAEGRTAMAGPVLPPIHVTHRATPYFDGSFILYEWVRNWLRVAHFDDAGNLLQIDPLFSTIEFQRPIDMKVGPDGALYVIEWGTGFWGDNPDAQLVRLQYARGMRPPTARLEATPTDGSVPLTVAFDARAIHTTPIPVPGNGDAWDIDSDGTVDSRSSQFAHISPAGQLHGHSDRYRRERRTVQRPVGHLRWQYAPARAGGVATRRRNLRLG